MGAVHYLDGAIMMAFLVAGLCYLRFWRRSRDRFFLFFAVSFWIMAVNRVFLALLTPDRAVPDENHVLLYIVRFAAFAILLLAIVEKNRSPRAGGRAVRGGEARGARTEATARE